MDPKYSHMSDSTNFTISPPSGSTSDHQTDAIINHSKYDHQFSDFLEWFDDWVEEDHHHHHHHPAAAFVVSGYTQLQGQSQGELNPLPHDHHQPTTNTRDSSTGSEREGEVREKVAFKTKSDIEILDDGFKWRKYGKKMVKNSPNPRNYYRCAVEGCPVKKRVERDREDPGYVITTYEAIHNHQVPSTSTSTSTSI